MNQIIENYFDAEAAIVARLEAQVPDLQKVFTPFDIADAVQSSQPNLCAHVIYAGDTLPGNEAGQGTGRVVAQKWLVIVAQRQAQAQLQNTIQIRSAAGIVIPKVLRALQGWAPVEWMRPLSRVPAPQPGFSSSFAYFPFMFEGRIIT